jgi:hypothetical protein
MSEIGALWVNFKGMGALRLAESLNITEKTEGHVVMVRLLDHIETQDARIRELEGLLRRVLPELHLDVPGPGDRVRTLQLQIEAALAKGEA